MDFDLQPIGDNAVMVSFGNQMDMLIHEQVRKLSAHLSANTFDWLTAFVPAYTNITIFYEPLTIMKHVTNTSPYDEICQRISSIVQQLQMESAEASNIIEIPVCYGGKHGPDLSYVAEKKPSF
ncbi:carboxyltransferase domain-containing protein [Virgibacillus halophilus]|uniref:Carboxyltransferase domain-containing protein n=1 Tax=Tigheibacillus halophilus TaxID=361280 RepID=A0ABU5C3B6_9BACI|nr:carboxyltransferase domain-containing protein [Virgibacillus halophilus]